MQSFPHPKGHFYYDNSRIVEPGAVNTPPPRTRNKSLKIFDISSFLHTSRACPLCTGDRSPLLSANDNSPFWLV